MNIVYKTTNLINGKIYIGVHTTGSATYLGSGIAITRAIAKYGKENFSRETLQEFSTPEEAFGMEEYYIQLFNARDTSIGYNISYGGKGGNTGNYEGHKTRFKGSNNPMYGKHLTEAQKDKQRASHKLWRETDEGKAHIEEKREFFLTNNPGKNKSVETCRRLSDACRGRKVKPSVTFKIEDEFGVIYLADGVYNLQGFCKYAGISYQSMLLKCRGKPYNSGSTAKWNIERV